MKVRKPLAAALALAAAGGLTMVGCSSSTGVSDNGNSPVSLSFWDNNGGPQRTPYWKTMIAQCEKQYPNIHVSYTGITSTDAFQKYKTAAAAGALPDVGVIDQGYYATLVGMKVLDPIDGRLASSRLAGKIVPTFLKASTAGMPGGHLYALPFSSNLGTIWYRTDYFQQAKIFGPPETWPDFYADVAKLTDTPKGRYGFSLRGGDGGVSQLLEDIYSAAGISSFFTPDGQSTANEPGAVTAIRNFAAMYGKYTLKADVNNAYTQMVAEFDQANGVAMVQHNLGSLNTHKKAIPGKFVATALPKAADGKRYVVPEVVTTLGSFNTSKHPDAAWKIIACLDNHQEDSYWNRIVGQIPANTDAFNDAWVAQTPSTANAIKVLQSPDTVTVPAPMYLPGFSQIIDTDLPADWQKVLLGQETAQTFANKLANELTSAYADYKAHSGS